MIHLFAHNSKNLVKLGDKVKAYDKYIGEIGNANNQYFSHLHYSVSDGLTPPQLKAYIVGWTKEKVLKYYKKPNIQRALMFEKPVDNGEAGYGWLQSIGNGYHPARDYNGFGGGNSDLGYKFKSPVDGEVIFAGDWGSGWGQVILIDDNQLNNKMKESNQKFYDEKESSQGWDTLEDWVEAARDYRDDRDEARDEVKELGEIKRNNAELLAENKLIEKQNKSITSQLNSLKLTSTEDVRNLRDEVIKRNEELEEAIESCQNVEVSVVDYTWGKIAEIIIKKLNINMKK